MDTDGCSCLNAVQIADDVNLSAQVSPAYISVDTHMDYPAYALEWANAVHAAGRHVWFRSHPNSWEGSNGTSAILTPTAYLTFENNWILANPGLFKSGDILDANPEAENSPYWVNTYGPNWSWQGAPDAATDAFNNFLVAVKTTADTALAQLGITGVDTGVRSVNEWFGQNPTALYPSTITALGHLTIDSYPDQNTTDPATAANDWLTVLNTVHGVRPGVKIVIGEMGYSNAINVTDTQQANVLAAELAVMKPLTWLSGQNYWVGAGTSNSGGYTHLFAGSSGAWTLRPAASELAAYFNAR